MQPSGRFPVEDLPDDWADEHDDGTMPANVAELAGHVVGRKIVSVGPGSVKKYGTLSATVLTLDDGSEVALVDTDDCCAYTELESFLLNVENIDHVILGVEATDRYTTWHIFADLGDVMTMKVGWSCGNPFYYGYGFDIRVTPSA